MEILFLWFYDYKNLKRQGLNFTPEYNFTMENSLDENFRLRIKTNPKYIPKFWDNTNIINISAIIGQNGTGKSNTLDFIKETFPEGNSSLTTVAILGLRFRNENNTSNILLIPAELNIEIEDPEAIFEIEKFYKGDTDEALGQKGSFSDSTYIYYSNIFDLKIEEPNLAGLRNISTNALLRADTEISNRDFQLHNSDLDNYKSNEIRRNIQFLLSQDRNLIDFPLPENLYLSILENDRLSLISNNKDLKKVSDNFEKKNTEETQAATEKIINKLHSAVFFNFLRTDNEFSSISFYKKFDLPQNESIKEYVISFFEKVKKTSKVQQHQEKANKIINLLLIFESHLANGKIVPNLFENTLRFPINSENEQTILAFISLYIQSKGLSDFIDFKWRSLSSGEQSFFSFVSRFYNIKVGLGNEDLRNNLIILIDEGDICFHPEWQRRFFKLSINFLSNLFSKYSLQLIFTANTPFIASDLPKSNIIFIEKRSDNSINILNQDNSKSETFGGNIHTLLSDSFYMNGALIGEFAKDKINQIITFLNSIDTVPNANYKKIIEQIGEPILRRKLGEMWYEKFGLDEEINELEKRLNTLKTRRNDQNRKKRK